MAGGRHRTRPRGGRNARIAVYLTAGVMAAGGLAAWRSGDDEPCVGEIRLRVAAAAEIAPALRDTARDWATGARAAGNRCVVVDVEAVAPADVAVAVTSAAGAALSGVTSESGTTLLPDVWVPDSITWLDRVRTVGKPLVPAEAESIARSPVVIAMPEPVASGLGWPAARLTWTSLMQQVTGGQPLKLGIVEPVHDSAGLSGLMALGAAATEAGRDADALTVAVMRALIQGRTNATSELLTKFPQRADAAAIASALTAAPLAEREVIEYNARRPPVRLAALYLEPAPPDLDYPYAVMPDLATGKAEVARDLRRALTGDEFGDRLAEAGLRDADGSGSRAKFPSVPGAPIRTVATKPETAVVARALATWVVVTMPARMLAVIDVSGSMLTPVPTAGGATRGQVSVAAARRGLNLFDDDWSVGLWVFSRRINGSRDYREILPIRPMRDNRARLNQVIGTVAPIEGGETGLYDTILAAYRTVKQGWDPKAVNSVVVLTDGFNRDDGLTLDQLIAALRREKDARKPIQIIAIGIGNDVGEAELRRITGTSGGGTFIARDPSAIGEIFLKAIALRPGAPPS
jgi:Ca-activated chloride channel family protein